MEKIKKIQTTRGQRVVINVISTLLLQFFTMVCGLIVPRVILGTFGSTVNGTVSSIMQFLSYIALMEAGVGGVVKAALYQPLAEKDYPRLSGILRATQDFFRKVAAIFIGYMLLLTMLFPVITHTEFEWSYTASLIVIIGISTAAQYYFGLTYQLLLQSDQKLYIVNALQIISIVANTVLVILLTAMNCSIHWVKFGSALVFILRPLLIYSYVKRHYALDPSAPADKEAIQQRWDGFGQHIAYFVHNNTDVVVLSIFTNMREVSVYMVHLSVVNGIKTLLNAMASGLAPAMGDMIAKKEMDTLHKTVDMFECVCFFLSAVFFTITALMIEPFVLLYTNGIKDVNYFRPVFAYAMCIAAAACVVRDVYSTVVLSAGHYRQTSRGAYMEAAINIICSIILVRQFGLVGVAAGTCIAMIYRTLDYVHYLSVNILNRPMVLFFKRLAVNLGGVAIAVGIIRTVLTLTCESWLLWIVKSGAVSMIVVSCVLLVNIIFYKKNCQMLLERLKKRQ